MREIALRRHRGAVREPLDELAEIIRPPEVTLQAPAPLRRDVERIDETGEEREVAELDREIVEPGGAHALDRETQHLDIGGGAIGDAEALDARLQELAR